LNAPRLILIGRVAGAFGVRGELRITTFSADPLSLLTYRELKREDGTLGLTLTAGRAAKGGIVARAREVETRDEAEAIRGLRLYIAREDLAPPEEDEFYLADLIGLQARDLAGAVVGQVKTVENFGAGDLVEIAPAAGGPTFWLPVTREAVPEVRLAEGWISIDPPAEVVGDEP
jgi:16S rRNA processing protein RimM